jgi:hypothetical protein
VEFLQALLDGVGAGGELNPLPPRLLPELSPRCRIQVSQVDVARDSQDPIGVKILIASSVTSRIES